jgi:hypothetical protein
VTRTVLCAARAWKDYVPAPPGSRRPTAAQAHREAPGDAAAVTSRVHIDVSQLRRHDRGTHADGRMYLLSRMRQLPRNASPKGGRLLHILLLRVREVPADPTGQ